MKKILVLAIVAMFSFVIFAVSAERDSQKDAIDAFDYMDENGIEYEVDLKSAVKELPKGAKLLSVDEVSTFLENAEVDVEVSFEFPEDSFEGDSGYNVLMSYTHEGYVYWNYAAPSGRKMKLTGGTSLVGGDGYLYRWERNTNNNQSNPGWTSVTRNRHCPGGSTSTIVSSCNETNTSITIHHADDSESTFCSRCNNNFAYSIRFCANPYTISFVWTYIPGIGWYAVPTKIYMGWTCTLSSGTAVFDPIWNLCSTALPGGCGF